MTPNVIPLQLCLITHYECRAMRCESRVSKIVIIIIILIILLLILTLILLIIVITIMITTTI